MSSSSNRVFQPQYLPSDLPSASERHSLSHCDDPTMRLLVSTCSQWVSGRVPDNQNPSPSNPVSLQPTRTGPVDRHRIKIGDPEEAGVTPARTHTTSSEIDVVATETATTASETDDMGGGAAITTSRSSTSRSPHEMEGDLSGRTTAIEANGAAKIFPSGDGIRDLDLSVYEGTILGLIGPSGSGKTTTVKMFTGGIVPSSGSVRVFGSDPVGFSALERARIGYMPQRSVLYPTLTVDENLRFLSSLYGKQDRSRLSEVLDFVELSDHVDKRADEISGGMQRRLSLAGALAHNPDLLFLDEPTAGIDPVLRRKFWDRFTELKEQGHTLLVTTQYVGEAAYCDYIGVLADGDLLTVETPEGLRRTAYGGDLIDVEFTSRPDPTDVQDLQQALGATSAVSTSPVSIRYVVPEAAAAVPLLGTWSGERGVEIELAEQHVPPFDDVFVEIVEQARIDVGEKP